MTVLPALVLDIQDPRGCGWGALLQFYDKGSWTYSTIFRFLLEYSWFIVLC